MNSKHAAASLMRVSSRTFALLAATFCALAFATSAAAQPVVSFSKAFEPSTIGPGSTSLLVFTIDNTGGGQVTDLAFTDNLPVNVSLADPAVPTTDCPSAMLSAPDGGGIITFSDGELPAGATCTVEMLVTSSTVATHMNVSGDLTSSAGNSGTAVDDLVVDSGLPGFSKSFSPSSVPLGSRSTLTFTIDNTLNPSVVANVDFTDNLTTGLVVADPANASTDCVGNFDDTTLTAIPGTSVVTLDANGSAFGGFEVLASGATCSVSLDVVSNGVGALENVSGDLLADFAAAGRAVDTLTSTAGNIVLVKEFLADPVPPGGTEDLEFTILNRTRSNDATNVEFTDDLDATLSGLVATGLPASVCGGTVSGTSTLTFTGGFVPAASECSFTVTLQVPAGATPAIYPNITSAVTADLGGAPTTGNEASDDLFVFPAPVLEKTFLDDPTAAGNTTRLEFTLTNTSTTASAGDLEFTDVFNVIFPTASAVPPSECCGTGSTCTFSPLANPPPPSNATPAQFNVTDGILAPGASCTFEIILDVSPAATAGIYTNATSEVTATIDGDSVIGSPASADLEVVGVPRLLKSFTDDPVQPGDTVTLEFTLEHDEFAPGAATSIAFDDDLGAALTGLAPLGLPVNDVCGNGSQVTEAGGVLSLTGGELAPGNSCTFSVTLQVPAGAAPGNYTNNSTPVTATVSGLTATGLAAADDLLVTGLSFTKQFIDDPVIAGGTATLSFTIRNDGSLNATNMFFTDNLDAALSGLTASGLPASDVCGTGSSISGTTNLVFSGGNLMAGTSCSFDVTVQVPGGTSDGTYPNLTSNLTASEGGTSVTLPPATDNLLVDSTLLSLSKEFLDDPVTQGATANLRFTLENNSGNTATDITFTDDLDAALSGLQVTGPIPLVPCGAGSSVSGGSLLTFSGGNLAANDSCTFQLTVEVPAAAPAGLYTNTTSDATGDVGGLTVTGAAASDNLRVVATSFTKNFNGPSVAGGSPNLSFTITNLDTTNGIGALAFTDNLDAVIPGLVASGLPLNNICGAGSSISGTGFLTFTGGALAAAGSPGDTCTFQVPLAVPGATMAGGYPNTTSNLTSGGLVLNDPATATLVIEPPPTFGKVFQPNAIVLDGVSTLTFTIDNSASAVAAGNLSFVDTLPAGLEVASPANASNTCGATISATSGSGSVSLTGGSVAAGGTCTAQVDITGTAEGTFVNTSGDLTSTSGNSGPATDTIDVVSGEFVVTKSFRTEPVLPAGLVEMEISIVNSSAFPLTGITLNDDLDAVLPGLVAEGLPQADVCGTGSQLAGTSIVTLTGGNLGAGASCTLVVPIRVPADASADSFTNTTGVPTGTREGIAVEAEPASDGLLVEALGFTKSFDPSLVAVGGTTAATFQITNPDPANTVAGLTFSDDLNAFVPGMIAGNTPINDACGAGSLVDGTSTVTLTGGTLPAGGSCSFQVILNVPADAAPGEFTNTTSALTNSVGGTQASAAAASAVLGIQPAPGFTKAFSPDTVGIGEPATLIFTIDNSASQLDAESLAFEDILPTDMKVAATPAVSNGCGGTLVAVAGTGLIQLAGGSVSQGAVCQIQVDVIASLAGTLSNVSGDLTSSLGNSGSASAELTVIRTLPVPLPGTAWLVLLGLLLAVLGMHALTTKP